VADFFSGAVSAWAQSSVFATSSQSSCHGFRSTSGSLANASSPRTHAKSMSSRRCRICSTMTGRVYSGFSSRSSPSISGERVGRKGRVVKNDGLSLAAQETDLQFVPEVVSPLARPVGADALEPGMGFHVVTESVMSDG
jgi:hypothetical protein